MKDVQNLLSAFTDEFNEAIATRDGDWIVKGFIDIRKNIYTVSADTKVVSKIMELLLFPKFIRFAEQNGFKVLLSEQQNHYPDITFIDAFDRKYAIDIKSTYRTSDTRVNGMTLGAYTGYFRERGSKKNIKFPYDSYVSHFVFGLIYSRSDSQIDERKIFSIDQLSSIASVIRDFQFFVQEKYKIATDRPGSGNTKNIGSVINIEDLINGRGPFTSLGKEVFDDYWMYYLTKDMATMAQLSKPPYTNLAQYAAYKNISLNR
ncbi:MAG: EcoRV family type II restriction endonuclease [Magnetococcales bacterium]|nr:EcoRV family type II restriction endonuclease [Magnetococcales bacterium]MBF0115139.1 EcoRV family type II restriction endonuclease [Magnetococcales bacterium]